MDSLQTVHTEKKRGDNHSEHVTAPCRVQLQHESICWLAQLATGRSGQQLRSYRSNRTSNPASSCNLASTVIRRSQSHLLHKDELHVDHQSHRLERRLTESEMRRSLAHEDSSAGLQEHDRNRDPTGLEHGLNERQHGKGRHKSRQTIQQETKQHILVKSF